MEIQVSANASTIEKGPVGSFRVIPSQDYSRTIDFADVARFGKMYIYGRAQAILLVELVDGRVFRFSPSAQNDKAFRSFWRKATTRFSRPARFGMEIDQFRAAADLVFLVDNKLWKMPVEETVACF